MAVLNFEGPLISSGAKKRNRPPERMTLKTISGVNCFKTAESPVKAVAKTATEYHKMAKTKLKSAQNKNRTLKKLASWNILDMV